VCMFIASLVATVRANATATIPFYRNAPIVPPWSVPARLVGMILVLLSAALLAPTIGFWSIGVVLAGPIFALAAIAVHNRRLAAILDEGSAAKR
jgi:hypothetical protein